MEEIDEHTLWMNVSHVPCLGFIHPNRTVYSRLCNERKWCNTCEHQLNVTIQSSNWLTNEVTERWLVYNQFKKHLRNMSTRCECNLITIAIDESSLTCECVQCCLSVFFPPIIQFNNNSGRKLRRNKTVKMQFKFHNNCNSLQHWGNVTISLIKNRLPLSDLSKLDTHFKWVIW